MSGRSADGTPRTPVPLGEVMSAESLMDMIRADPSMFDDQVEEAAPPTEPPSTTSPSPSSGNANDDDGGGGSGGLDAIALSQLDAAGYKPRASLDLSVEQASPVPPLDRGPGGPPAGPSAPPPADEVRSTSATPSKAASERFVDLSVNVGVAAGDSVVPSPATDVGFESPTKLRFQHLAENGCVPASAPSTQLPLFCGQIMMPITMC
jgi:hypothetical protein